MEAQRPYQGINLRVLLRFDGSVASRGSNESQETPGSKYSPAGNHDPTGASLNWQLLRTSTQSHVTMIRFSSGELNPKCNCESYSTKGSQDMRPAVVSSLEPGDR